MNWAAARVTGGISRGLISSREPAIAIDNDGNPIVSWTTYQGAQSDIRVAKFNPASGASGAWISLGDSQGQRWHQSFRHRDTFKGRDHQQRTCRDVALNVGATESSLQSAKFSAGSWTSLGARSLAAMAVPLRDTMRPRWVTSLHWFGPVRTAELVHSARVSTMGRTGTISAGNSPSLVQPPPSIRA